MFDRVIVGVDGRPGGHDAIMLAERLAAPEAAVTFAHVCGAPTAAGRVGALSLPLQIEAAERMVGLAAKDSGLAAKPSVVYESSVPRGLHALAEKGRADLLVVGSCHRGLLGRTILGDDTRRVLSGAPCAVAIAPRGYAAGVPTSLGLARIGVGYEDSPGSARALEVARSLAERHGAVVKTLSVNPPQDDASQELAAFSAGVDLLVIGSHALVGFLFSGNTSRYLARHARCPLLVMPRIRSDTLMRAHERRHREQQRTPEPAA